MHIVIDKMCHNTTTQHFHIDPAAKGYEFFG